MPFRINAQHLFLTYPRWGNDKSLEDILDLVKGRVATINPAREITRYIVAKELHADGETHVHVYVKLDARTSIRDQHLFDIDGNHGNYQSCRSPASVGKYVAKGANYISDFYVKAKKWGDVLGSQTEDDFRSSIAEVAPRDLVLSHDRIERYIAKRYRAADPWQPKYGIHTFINHGGIRDFIAAGIADNDGRGKPLIVQSPSGYGKTQYIRTVLHFLSVPYIYMSGMFNADIVPENLDGIRFIIFDDFELEMFFKTSWKSWFGCQEEFTITDKYRGKRSLYFPNSWCFIWLCNEDNNPLVAQWGVSEQQKEYLRQRETVFIELNEKLF